MWKLTQLSFENYRTFQRPEVVELRPLTVLIGRNSAGKSAISRLPLLLARGVRPNAEAPLELEFDGHDFGASFLDLVNNRVPTRTITVGVNVSDGTATYRVCVAIGFWSEYRLQAVRGIKVSAGNRTLVDLIWDGEGDPVNTGLRYVRSDGEDPVGLTARFVGMFPVPDLVLFAGVEPQVQAAFDAVRAALSNLVYLGPFRDAPPREMRLPEATVRDIGLRGGNAARVLASDMIRQGSTVLRRVGTWYREHLGGWELDLEREGQSFSVVLRPPADPSVTVNLRDAGVGLSQVLPVIVQHELDRALARVGGLDIIEQPELHLHPGVHGDLADLYLEAVKRSAGSYLIETHSENFILRLRRRIAEGSIAPDEVAIYWVNDDIAATPRVRRIGLDASGGVDFWPRGVFAEDLDEVRRIRAAQRAQSP